MFFCQRRSNFLAVPLFLLTWGKGEVHVSAFSVTTPFSLVQKGLRYSNNNDRCLSCRRSATVVPQDLSNVKNDQSDLMLDKIAASAQESKEYAEMFGFSQTEAAIHAVFSAIRKAEIPLGLKGEPFVLRRDAVIQALQMDSANPPFDHFFTMQDFAKAVEEDFLDAARGSTDNRQGWKVCHNL